MKIRLDKLLLQRGLAPSRERAQALILAGKVLVNEQKIEKPGTLLDATGSIRLLGTDLKYVGRGGLKLEKALEHWKVDVAGWTCLDIGASTGGFTDCLLQRGAARVVAVDTGHGQFNFRLRQDPRVTLLEDLNARFLKGEQIDELVNLVVMDVSFISATLVLPAVSAAAFPRQRPALARQVIVLVKPQFEAGRSEVGKGGIIRDPVVQKNAIERVRRCLDQLGYEHVEVIESPILGAKGNKEFLVYGWGGSTSSSAALP